jgi:hypothetical protein
MHTSLCAQLSCLHLQNTSQHIPAQHSTAQHQHSTAQHQHSTAPTQHGARYCQSQPATVETCIIDTCSTPCSCMLAGRPAPDTAEGRGDPCLGPARKRAAGADKVLGPGCMNNLPAAPHVHATPDTPAPCATLPNTSLHQHTFNVSRNNHVVSCLTECIPILLLAPAHP